MTRSPTADILIIALILSALVHVGVMAYAKPRIMTHVAAGVTHVTRRGPMRVTKATETPPPAALDTLADVAPERDAPKPEDATTAPHISDAPAPADAAGGTRSVASAPIPPLSDAPKPEAPKPTIETFAAEALTSSHGEPLKAAPTPEISLTPPTQSAMPLFAKGDDAPWEGRALSRPNLPEMPTAAPWEERALSRPLEKIMPLEETKKGEPTFTPPEEVMAKVDEQVVLREKESVRALVDVSNAKELKPYVNAVMTRAETEDGIYFKVMFSPRTSLPTISKDFVLILDASGSIGAERMGSIRKNAKKLLRSAANTGDRFNLVAFRDRYSYAFKTWQPCTVEAYDAADRWLNSVAPHGRTDVFKTIASVLTLPRNPLRPMIALVVTDGDANSGVTENADILSQFTALNDGLVSVYMYGVKSSANRQLIDLLTRNNRGESFIHEGTRWSAGSGIEGLSERFREPVLSDLRVVFAAGCKAEAYPRLLRNLYRGGTLELIGRVPAGTKEIAFSLKGLNGREAFESFFVFPLAQAPNDPTVPARWRTLTCIILNKE